MPFLPKQNQLIENGKLLPFGIYQDIIDNTDTSYFDEKGSLLAKNRRTERKAWIFFGVYSPEIICGIAVVDAGMAATAFCYFYSLKDSTFIEDKLTVPFGFEQAFNPNLYTDFKLKNYSISHKNGKWKMEYNGKFNLIIESENNANGFSVVSPSQNRPFNFTYKNCCLPVSVQINAGTNKTYAVSGNYGCIDYTKGYPPRETTWNWLSFIGITENKEPVGVNLVDKFNNNMENVLWLNGEKIILSEAEFSMQKPFDKSDWLIATRDGILSCHMSPEGARSENINALILKSNFTQPFGRIDGTITLNGITQKFTAFGVAEDHYAYW